MEQGQSESESKNIKEIIISYFGNKNRLDFILTFY